MPNRHRKLPSLHYVMRRMADSDSGKRCPICLNQIEIRSTAVIIPCMHTYCIICIRRWSAIKCKCPLCNSDFNSWFCRDGKEFREEKVFRLGRLQMVNSHDRDEVGRRLRPQFFEQTRILRRHRGTSVRRNQARVLPRQRLFQWSSDESPAVIAERTRQWRASIYHQRLRALPHPSANRPAQEIPGDIREKEKTLERIRPWVERELQVILRDPDPTVIVHVVTSLFLKNHENFQNHIADVGGDFLAPLRPFLLEQTEAFWHELICFSRSPLSMEAYDTVTVYERVV